MGIKPIKIEGNWKEGYVLDEHTISSEYLYDNEYGHPVFETIRSELGELLYKLKYKHNKKIIDDIIELINPFVTDWTLPFALDVIISMPPSNKNRNYQPVNVISEALANKLNIRYCGNYLEKKSNVESKNLVNKESISYSMCRKKYFIRDVNVLLVDDLYKTGASMMEAVRVLKEDENVKNIYVLALTKTRRS
jgi:predicted amidophosphoribosyltransferase